MISVILCHHKGDLILKAIESLLASRNVSLEIIVVTSEEGREFAGTRTVFVKGGPAHKRNIAARFANGEYLAFYDDDIEADTQSLEAQHILLNRLPNRQPEHLEGKIIAMTFGKLLNMEFRDRFDEAGSFLTPTGFLWARAESGIQDRGQYEVPVPVLAGKSAACMILRRVFWEVGGFDASYEILGEETDLAWRVWLAGYCVYYCPQSITYHAFNTKFKPRDFYVPRRVYFNGCRNYLTMLITNLEGRNLIIPVLVHAVVWPVAAMGLIITGKFEAGTYIFRGLGWVLLNLNTILRKRHSVQSKRAVSDRELFPFILRTPGALYFIKRLLRYVKIGLHG